MLPEPTSQSNAFLTAPATPPAYSGAATSTTSAVSTRRLQSSTTAMCSSSRSALNAGTSASRLKSSTVAPRATATIDATATAARFADRSWRLPHTVSSRTPGCVSLRIEQINTPTAEDTPTPNVAVERRRPARRGPPRSECCCGGPGRLHAAVLGTLNIDAVLGLLFATAYASPAASQPPSEQCDRSSPPGSPPHCCACDCEAAWPLPGSSASRQHRTQPLRSVAVSPSPRRPLAEPASCARCLAAVDPTAELGRAELRIGRKSRAAGCRRWVIALTPRPVDMACSGRARRGWPGGPGRRRRGARARCVRAGSG